MNPSQSSTGVCYNCGSNSPILLLTRSTGRFCSNCILKQNKGTFCPVCFELFDDLFLPNLHIMCQCCPSVAHRSCLVPSAFLPNLSAFRCPSCADPNFKFQSDKAIVAASQISAISLRNAAAAARLYAEQRAMEAAKAKKNATEALDHLSTIASKEQGTSTKE